MKSRTRKRLILGLLTAIAFGAAGLVVSWYGLNRYIDSQNIEIQAVQWIEQRTGLPAQVDDFDIVLFPQPALAARNVKIGYADFAIAAQAVTANATLSRLLRGDITVDEITIHGPTVTVPQTVQGLRERVEAVENTFGRTKPASRQQGNGVSVNVDHIRVLRGAVLLANGRSVAELSGDVWPRPGGESRAEFTGTGPPLGDDFQWNGEVTYSGNRIAFKTHVEDAHLAPLMEGENIPLGYISADISGNGSLGDGLLFTLDGSIAESEDAMFAGDFRGRGKVSPDEFTVNDFVFDGSGFHADVNFTRHADGVIDVMVDSVEADRRGLETVAAQLPENEIKLRMAETATMSGRSIMFSLNQDFQPTFYGGDATLAGLDFVSKDNGLLVNSVTGSLEFNGNQINITSLTADGINLAGNITLNEEFVATINLAGDAELSDDRLRPALDVSQISGIGGQIVVDSFAVTIGGDTPPLDTLKGNARIDSGSIAIDVDGNFVESIRDINGSFTFAGNRISGSGSATGDGAGPFRIENIAFDLDAMTIAGDLIGDVDKLANDLYWNDWARTRLRPVFAAHGSGPIQWNVQLPRGKSSLVDLRARTGARQQDAWLEARAAWSKNQPNKGYGLDVIQADGAVPAERLNGFLEGLEGTGLAEFKFDRPSGKEKFEVAVDLDRAALQFDGPVGKPVGVPGQVVVAGITNAPGWKPQTLNVRLADETITGAFEENGIAFRSMAIDLAKTQPIFPQGTYTSGILRGDFGTQPVSASLVLENVAVNVDNAQGLTDVNGAVQWRDNGLRLNKIDVNGANSNITFDGTFSNGTLTGTLNGRQLDVLALRQLANALASIFDNGEGTAQVIGDTSASTPFQANLSAQFDTVLYRAAEEDRVATFSDASGRIVYDDQGLHILELMARPYSGRLTGSLELLSRKGQDGGVLKTDLEMAAVDMRVLDEMFYDQPQGLEGFFEGAAAMTVPIGGEVPPQNAMSGQVSLKAREGTLGEIGFSTALLNVLKTLQIWNLPHAMSGKSGLIYDDLSVKMSADNGMVTVNELALRNPYMRVDGAGELKFPQSASELSLEVRILEGFFTPIRAIPVVGKVGEDVGIIHIQMTGPPTEMNARITGVEGFRGLRDRLKDAGKGAVDTVEKQVIDRVLKGLGGLIGQ